jgi:purine-nucleoside phosphorylase
VTNVKAHGLCLPGQGAPCVNLAAVGELMTPDDLRRVAAEFRERYRPGCLRGLLAAGSGLQLEVPGWESAEEIDLAEVLPFALHALIGHRQTTTLWRRGEESLMVLNGRFHLYQGYRPEEVVAPVRLAGLLGAKVMIAINATGALDPTIEPGSIVVITDHLNLQGSNPLVGEWGRELGPQFPDMSEAYDSGLRAVAVEAAEEAGFAVHEGVYVALLGPSFETPAEIRMLKTLGGTVVGMSTVPEVIAARHMGMKVLVLSFAANPAAGLVDRPLTHTEVLEEGERAAPKLAKLMGVLVETIFGKEF